MSTPAPRCFRVIRFYRQSYRRRTIHRNLTEAEAKRHCSRPDTQGANWFDGYDYMPGCRPKEGKR